MSEIEVTLKYQDREHHSRHKCKRVESLEFEITRLRKENNDLITERLQLEKHIEWLEKKLNRANSMAHDLGSITRVQCR